MRLQVGRQTAYHAMYCDNRREPKKNVGMLCEGMYGWLRCLQPEPIFGHIVNEVVTVKHC